MTLLSADPDPEIRGRIARRTDLRPPSAGHRALAAAPDPDVPGKVAHHADLGPAERRTLATDPDTAGRPCPSTPD
ncbi:hypothetical protein OG233_08485 [Streptomyces sp. NBC_01218]|uniref:hypothetical protein n=1 Tax=Streptomyces sp. NBC_01218 TaxID=2903780 RepID=UPI002E0DEFDC|nr:hypothetical protein OG233_08485 [Streptomyces sp. NBC_01218]